MNFRVGQKVVCVDGRFSRRWMVVPNWPLEGEIYTIRGLRSWYFPRDGVLPAIYLAEIVNDEKLWVSGEVAECPFWAGRFRPLVERKTDISIFTELLTPTGPRVLEPAGRE